MSEPTLKLPHSADELLREFPATEPDFEAQAQAIQARLKGSPGGMVFDDWLKVPELPAEPGEPSLASSVRTAPKTNFAEMARKSVQKKDDSVEVAKEFLAATAQNRRPDAEMVERVRRAVRVPATSTPLPAEEPQRNSGVVERAPARARANATAESAPAAINRGTLIGIAGGVFALAAAVALFVKSGQPDKQTSAALAAENAADAPAAIAPKSQVDAPPAAEANNNGVVSPETLAAAPVPQVPKVSPAKASPAGAAAPASTKAASRGAKQEAVVLEEEPTPVRVAPDEAKPAKPEPTPEPQLKPAEGSTSSVPLNPSAGAISTALGSVRSNAQACLAGQSDPVTAVVTFSADGHVVRVSAAGPSGACIQAALSKARIAPFAKDSYSATTTIRPP